MSRLIEIEIPESDDQSFPLPTGQVISVSITTRDAKDFNGSGYTKPVRFARVVLVIEDNQPN